MRNLILILALFLGAAFIGDLQAAEPQQLTKIERAKKEEARVAKLAKEGIPFRTEFTWATVEDLIKEIDKVAKVTKKGEYITILLDSGGGGVFAGVNLIHNIMKYQAQGIKFRGVVENVCFSMCFITLETLNDRVAYPFAMIMDHRPSGGSKHVLQEIVEMFKPMVDARLKVNKELYEMAVYSEVWLGTAKAVRWGLLDRVVYPGMPVALPVALPVKLPVKK